MPSKKEKIKILIVDDEEAVRVALKWRLDNSDTFIIEEASNGKETLEKVEMDKPDIILLDVTMPIMDGLQTYKKLKENPETKHIHVIFSTARTYTDIARLLPIGADEYIEKTCEIDQLHTRINKIIGLINK